MFFSAMPGINLTISIIVDGQFHVFSPGAVRAVTIATSKHRPHCPQMSSWKYGMNVTRSSQLSVMEGNRVALWVRFSIVNLRQRETRNTSCGTLTSPSRRFPLPECLAGHLRRWSGQRTALSGGRGYGRLWTFMDESIPVDGWYTLGMLLVLPPTSAATFIHGGFRAFHGVFNGAWGHRRADDGQSPGQCVRVR